MDKKSKYTQFDSKLEKKLYTNETHLFPAIISFFFPAWGEIFRGRYKNWLLYSFVGFPLVILLSVALVISTFGLGIPFILIIVTAYQLKCARMSYNDKGLTDGLGRVFTKRNMLILILIVIIGIFALRTAGLMANEQYKAKNHPITNNTTNNNTTAVNTTVEKLANNDDVSYNSQESKDTSSNGEQLVWYNGNYAPKEKIDIIKTYGMGPESEKAMKEAGY